MRTRLRDCHAGFTLIELLVVVAIISILAGIAVPNFLEAQTRSKVSRVKNDQRVIATALETYLIDHNHYPPRHKYPVAPGIKGGGDVYRRAEDMSRLTTPISYISALPEDVFETHLAPPDRVLDYWEPAMVTWNSARNNASVYIMGQMQNSWGGWAVYSVGPDRIYGTQGPSTHYPVKANGEYWWSDYDPTNGTISEGNIWRFQRQGAQAYDVFRANN